MGVLDRFERRLDRIVNTPFQKAFKAEVQPVEVAAALRRECDDRAVIVDRSRTIIPNEFVIELSAHDHGRLNTYAEALTTEFVALIREHAIDEHYQFTGPVTVRLEQHDDLDTGVYRIRSQALAGRQSDQTADSGGAPGEPAAGRPHALAYLEVGGDLVPLTSMSTVIGRGSDTDLQLADPGISRRHSRIDVTSAGVQLTDLDSTNGTFLDEQKITGTSPVLDGATIRLGTTRMIFRAGRGE